MQGCLFNYGLSDLDVPLVLLAVLDFILDRLQLLLKGGFLIHFAILNLPIPI